MPTLASRDDLPMVQRLSAVLWPSFLLAGTATVVFFTFFDPLTLMACEGEPPLSRLGAYSLGFFLFWLLCASSSLGSAYFLRSGLSADAGPQPRSRGGFG